MKRTLTITSEPINESTLIAQRSASKGMGAVVYFLGVVRDNEGVQTIAGLEYEAFQKMAEHQFTLLFDKMETRWPIESVRVVHRVGKVLAGEASLWIEVVTPHRAEALAACGWLIDEMKRSVPIWKKVLSK